jgi:Ca2+-binding RTX toxin-like protein
MSNKSTITQQLFFIDFAVPDSQTLLANLPANSVYYFIDHHSDGLQQMADILSEYQDLTAIHVISHGSSGSLQLGNSLITQDTLNDHSGTLATIGNALTETGDILLYGCDVAQGDTGQAFIEQLATLTGADVAASTDLTGAADKGGDWVLETQTGAIESTSIAPQNYTSILQNFVVQVPAATNISTTISGTLGIDNLSIDYSAFNINVYGLNWAVYDSANKAVSMNSDSSATAIQAALSTAVTFQVNMGGYNVITFDGIENLSLTSSNFVNFNDLLIVQGSGNYDGKGGMDTLYADWSSGTSAVTIHNSDLVTVQDFNTTVINIERWLIKTGSGDDVISTNNTTGDQIDAGNGNNTITTGDGKDIIDIGTGNDIINAGAGSNIIHTGAGNDTISMKTLTGANDSSTISGGTGTDSLSIDYSAFNINVYGLNWTVYDSANKAVSLDANSSAAAIQAALSTAITFQVHMGGYNVITFDGIENLSLTSSNFVNFSDLLIVQGTGNYDGKGNGDALYADWSSATSAITWINDPTAVSQTINGNTISNIERLLVFTGSGDDVIDNRITSMATDDQINTNLGNDSIYGGSGDDSINAGAGNDLLDGGTGNDSLIGGAGDDTYIVDSTADVVTELAGQGFDTVYSSISYTLGSDVENLILTGTAAAINGGGNALNNQLTGNSANNILSSGAGNDTISGGSGIDTMTGGLGNDSYSVSDTGDVVVENLNEGTDTVSSRASSYTLAANVENLILTGVAAINGGGNALNNQLTGNSADNVLSGGSGIDTMIGGLGDDSYSVSDTGDVVVENLNEGTDTVSSRAANYTLAANVENLILTGTAAINGSGNALNNQLTGNSADNVLSGGSGIDTMTGGLGNDSYSVSDATDVVIENLNEGTDTVSSRAATYTLATNVENLILTGTAAINGGGNALNNQLTGNGADNVLRGGLGEDILIGGLGKDTYNLAEATAATDTLRIATGDSLVSSYDIANAFKLGTGTINTIGVDRLDLVSTVVATNVSAINGIDSGTILSHNINNGIISFDDINNYTTPLTITAATNLADVFGYLQTNITANNTVAFVSEGNTFVFQDGGATDTLVELVGVVAQSVNTSGLATNAVWII